MYECNLCNVIYITIGAVWSTAKMVDDNSANNHMNWVSWTTLVLDSCIVIKMRRWSECSTWCLYRFDFSNYVNCFSQEWQIGLTRELTNCWRQVSNKFKNYKNILRAYPSDRITQQILSNLWKVNTIFD